MGTWPRRGPVTPAVLSAFFHPEIYPLPGGNITVSTALGTNNLALYYPYLLPEPVTVTKAWWQNGATAAGTVSVGIYDDQGNQLVTTGSQTQTGVSTVQSVDITDTVIHAGLIFLGLSGSLSTATFWATGLLIAAGGSPTYSIYQQTAAHPLPNPATFAITAGSAIPIHKFGFLVAPRTVL